MTTAAAAAAAAAVQAPPLLALGDMRRAAVLLWQGLLLQLAEPTLSLTADAAGRTAGRRCHRSWRGCSCEGGRCSGRAGGALVSGDGSGCTAGAGAGRCVRTPTPEATPATNCIGTARNNNIVT